MMARGKQASKMHTSRRHSESAEQERPPITEATSMRSTKTWKRKKDFESFLIIPGLSALGA